MGRRIPLPSRNRGRAIRTAAFIEQHAVWIAGHPQPREISRERTKNALMPLAHAVRSRVLLALASSGPWSGIQFRDTGHHLFERARRASCSV